MPEVSGLSITIDEDDDSVRTDPITGTVETDQPDGGVVVQLRNRPAKAEGEDETRHEGRAHHREGHEPEGRPARCAQVGRGLLEAGAHAADARDRSSV